MLHDAFSLAGLSELIVYCVSFYQPSVLPVHLCLCMAMRAGGLLSVARVTQQLQLARATRCISLFIRQAHACGIKKLLQLVQSKPVCCSLFDR